MNQKVNEPISVVSRALAERPSQFTRATRYWPRRRPQVAVVATRAYPRQCGPGAEVLSICAFACILLSRVTTTGFQI